MSVEKYRMALAGLLHDIGKFAQRASEEWRGEWFDENQQDFRYPHALLSDRFITEHVPKQADVRFASYHHAPERAHDEADLARVVQLADWLSAGDRLEDDTDDTPEHSRIDHPKQLHPIFAQITLNGQPHPEAGEHDRFFLPLGELRLEKKRIFPEQAPMTEEAVWRTYAAMWDKFTGAAERLKASVEAGEMDLPAYVEAMQALMMRYTWSIPAAYWKTYADTSLYDHSRMTAALAVALADLTQERLAALADAWRNGSEEAAAEPVALLIGGDVSGVQQFIYTIAAKGAAKMLRGRSFYLQLLTEAVLRFVLRKLDLPTTSVIYSGGGNFYLLAPLSAAPRLDALQAEIAEILTRYHDIDLYLVLGRAEVPLRGFRLGAFPEFWGQMHADIQRRKTRRYAEWPLEKMYAEIFAVPEYGGNPDNVCSVCGSERRATHKWEDDKRICTLCASFANDLGKILPKAKAVRWVWEGAQPQKDPFHAEWRTALEAFGARPDLLEEWPPSLPAGQSLWALDDPPEGYALDAPLWLRYAVTSIPTVRDQAEAQAINDRLRAAEKDEEQAEVGQTKTFGQLQAQTQSGFERLGVLRMDVDNLGLIFKDGLGDKASLSRLAALSFQMGLFFEGWVEQIISTGAWANRIYAVYAGGDDLFLVGPWDVMPDLALKIVDEFAKYTGGHPALHLSGGMAFIHGKYPIYQAAADAGEAEAQAKALDGKNAFAFLGRAWKWEEFKRLQEKEKRLVALVRGEGEEAKGKRSVLRLLRNMAAMMETAARGVPKGKPVWGRWMWLTAYQLRRMAEQDKARASEYEALSKALEDNDFADLPAWGVAARWAELMVRKRHGALQNKS